MGEGRGIGVSLRAEGRGRSEEITCIYALPANPHLWGLRGKTAWEDAMEIWMEMFAELCMEQLLGHKIMYVLPF